MSEEKTTMSFKKVGENLYFDCVWESEEDRLYMIDMIVSMIVSENSYIDENELREAFMKLTEDKRVLN